MFEPSSSLDSKAEHDKLAWRLTQMLMQLNQGDCLDATALAVTFGVHRRTIMRDLNDRFAFLPLIKSSKGYTLDSAYLGRLNYRDLEKFAALAGLNGLFPALTADFLREIFDQRLQAALLIHGPRFEKISEREPDFLRIREAILNHQELKFTYQKPDETKDVQVQPYKLISHDGIWYLAASDNGQPKAYALGRISHIQQTAHTFAPDITILKMLQEEDSIWLNRQKTEAVIQVNAAVAQYFRRQTMLPSQVIEKTLTDGGLLISGKFAHQNQLFPTVRQWIPHLRIISPEFWQAELEEQIRDYLQ